MGIRSERRLCEEVHLNLAYRWFADLVENGPAAFGRHGGVSRRLFRHRPTFFLKLLAKHGGVETVRRLARGLATSGFETLWEHGRLDPSVEALILQRQWRELFSDEEAKIARRRLKDFGYVPDSKPTSGS
jgi:hypothetical protein